MCRFHQRLAHDDARGVDQNLERLITQPAFDLTRHRDVDRQRFGAAPFALDAIDGPLRRRHVPVEHQDMRSGGAQQFRRAAADARASAGNVRARFPERSTRSPTVCAGMTIPLADLETAQNLKPPGVALTALSGTVPTRLLFNNASPCACVRSVLATPSGGVC